ncbi:MAG: hypothetical protein Kow00124_05990 [Anaerolineae bacterium]
MTGTPSTDQRPVPTERFQRILAFASDEAEGLGHGFVTCQHLLYALSRESRGVARAVLDSLGISAEVLHDMLAETSAEHDRLSGGRIDLADEARDAIDRAVNAAVEWGHRVLDTEHLLYGIISSPTVADEMLSALRITPDEVLRRLYNVQQAAPPPPVRDGAAHAYRFTLESAWVMSLAVDVARRQGAARVSGVHLLIALVSLESPARDLLVEGFGVTAEAIYHHIGGQGVGAHTRGRLPLSTEVQRILGFAIGEAWNRGHLAVAPLHLAMGLARADQGGALDLLAEMGVSQSRLIDELEDVMPPPVAG